MKLNKNIASEVWKVYDTWIQSYLNGDVETYNSYLDDEYHFIGSAKNEEFLNRKDTTQFFEDTGDEFAGKTELRNESKSIEQFGELIFITHIFDGWFLNEKDWTYYARFRFSSTLRKNKDGWRFIYQHFSIPDSKTEDGGTIGYDKINEENQELREAIQRRTKELEDKNRELEIEGALQRIRAEAVAMKETSDLLDIVVTMRTEFTRLGHEAHYFWHMMWHEETYEKAMTSGDGTKIGFVMELPRHIHGDIPLLAKWEKSKNPMVVYAMDAEEAIAYVDKMVHLGDFKNIDPQAPSHDDIRYIKGLTFIMARTTHGEIGYSLPGKVGNPPKEDLEILEKFAGAFDLAHRRFLDLQKAEQQAREVQIELALEKVRSRSMAMQSSEELKDAGALLYQELSKLGIQHLSTAYTLFDETATMGWSYGVNPMDGSIRHKPVGMDHTKNKVMKTIAASWKKQQPVSVIQLNEQETITHQTFIAEECIDFPLSAEKLLSISPERLVIHTFNFKQGYLLIVGGIELTVEQQEMVTRFANVFQQTYTRFLDLQKAEEQAREKEIELALEKVRSRTMAMQHSDELPEAANLLFTEVQKLGIPAWSCGYNILAEDKKSSFCIMSSEGEMQIPFILPLTEHKSLKPWYKAIKNNKKFFVYGQDGKDLVEHYNYMKSLPELKSTFEQFENADIELPKQQYNHLVRFNEGFLLFITYEEVQEAHDLFKRFGKVFEQTYTRFLDLQKAEVQAREAQIETALERVRSRSMAMHHSDEIEEVIQVVYHQFVQLNINIDHAGFILDYKENDAMHIWLADHNAVFPKIVLPYFDCAHWNSFLEAKKKGQKFFANQLGFEEKNTFYKDLFGFIPELPEETKNTYFGFDGLAISTVLLDTIGLYIENYAGIPFSEEENAVLMRFGQVFQQAYTRFLDLQKAEAQTREALIEAALERTRTQSMLMQHSDELDATSKVFHEQLQLLGIATEFSYVWLPDEANNEHQFWVAWNSEKKGSPAINSKAIVYPLDKNEPYTAACFNDWVSGIAVHVHEIKPTEVKTFFTAWEELLKDAKNLNPKYFSNGLYYAEAFMKYGCFGINIKRPVSDEEKQILQRFSVEFERTYSRFINLKKAEAQTREAQIETALERVRSRSMAMHNSDEIGDVAFELFEQLKSLGGELWGTGFGFCKKDSNVDEFWFANENGIMPHSKIPNNVDEAHKKMYQGWEKNLELFSIEKSGKELKDHYKYMLTVPDVQPIFQGMLDNGISFPKRQKWYAAYFKYGYLLVITTETYDDEGVFKRFAKVFEQAYTRFLDLQKAEAQARESEIELGLERLRARAMAMQNSDELSDLVATLLNELTKLDFSLTFCIINIYNEANLSNTVWAANPEEGKAPESYYMKFEDYPFHHAMMREWKAQTPKFEYIMEGEEKEIYDAYLFTDTEFRRFPKEVQDANRALDRYVASFVFSPFGGLQTVGDTPLTDESLDILYRFGKVFDQTYTRFLDLKKAEAQARESQIQLSLERVRAKTMAMQHSDELVATSELLFQQIKDLGIEVWSCGYSLWYDDDTYFVGYNPMPDGKMGPPLTIPLTEDVFFKTIRNAKREGKEFLVFESKGKSLVKTYQYMDGLPVVGEAMRGIVEAGFELPKYQVTHCGFFTHGHLMFITHEHYPEAHDIFKRFTKEFEQTYTRFLDLQKAEAQSRESQIQLSLERVRAKAMSMHDSNELDEVLSVLCEQFDVLGIYPMSTHMTVFNFDENTFTFRETGKYGNRSLCEQTVALDAMDNWKETVNKWKADEARAINKLHFPKEQLPEVWKVFHESFASMPEESRITPKDYPEGIFHTAGKHPFGYIGMNQTRPATKEEEGIVVKFANEFGRAYQRFLDLQKAEAQSREAQIEAALEKIRSRSLAMQSPDELQEVVAVVAEKLKDLDVIFDAGGVILCTYFPDNKNVVHWIAVDDFSTSGRYLVPYFENPIFTEAWDSKIRGDAYFSKEFPVEAKNHFFEHAFEHSDYKHMPEDYKEFVLNSEQHRLSAAWSKNSAILIPSLTGAVPSESDADIMKRFAKVFEQAYIRFMDLQKAEARAREAKIENALERVRSHSMGMQSSKDFSNVTTEMFNQLRQFGGNLYGAGIVFCDKHEGHVEQWHSVPGAGMLTPFIVPYNLDEIHQYRFDQWKKGTELFSIEITEDVIDEHFEKLFSLPSAQKVLEDFASKNVSMPETPNWEIDYGASFKNGYLLISSFEHFEEACILPRFAKVFEQAYTRFLDLEKAEAQAREAQIEASLEKVRTVALTLTKSDEMLDIAQVLYEQLLALGFKDIRNAIIDIHNDETETFLDYDYSHDMSSAITEFSYYGDPVIEQQIKKTQSANDAFFEIELKGEQLQELIETRLRNGEKDDPRLHEIDHLTYNLYSFGNGAIGISNFGILSDEQKIVLKRFRNVFTFAYKRYTDLANAEAQAREAKIEAALEKVRSVALSMVESTDLLHIVKALYEQLVELGFSDIRNALIDLNNEDEETFLDYDYSDEMGGTITLMSYDDDPTLVEQVKDIAATTDGFSEMVLEEQQLQDLIEMRRKNGEAEDPRLLNTDSVSYNLYAFGNGAVGISNFGVLSKDQKTILDRFRNVFTFAYQRFKDLQVREEQSAALLAEKVRLEKTLTDLQETQKQLIQSEKMASLGELTAGIAHEIQNPLNFVNNFSEVSNELIDEMNEEIEKGDLEEAKHIANDIKQNLEKINHHGKRADAIVKGMLQHSRKSTAEKVPTDINKLADEYLRLAYHGLRAKDKSFNATLETDFDETIGKVNVIPQDMGRVILNLITNAFYATNERKKTSEESDFKPTVSVSTKKENDHVLISVQDNGNGIPKHVVDKIFQPFFTTKPTGEGTGLGLSMSYDIVTKGHGGELGVETKTGQGTKFIIKIPNT